MNHSFTPYLMLISRKSKFQRYFIRLCFHSGSFQSNIDSNLRTQYLWIFAPSVLKKINLTLQRHFEINLSCCGWGQNYFYSNTRIICLIENPDHSPGQEPLHKPFWFWSSISGQPVTDLQGSSRQKSLRFVHKIINNLSLLFYSLTA